MLVRLNPEECVIENNQGLRIHHPRWNFRVREVVEERAKV